VRLEDGFPEVDNLQDLIFSERLSEPQRIDRIFDLSHLMGENLATKFGGEPDPLEKTATLLASIFQFTQVK